MDFRAEAAPVTSQCLRILLAILSQGSGGTRVSTNDGALDKQMLHIWVSDEMLMPVFSDFVIAPSCKPFVDAVPVAMRFWQQSPLGTAAGEP